MKKLIATLMIACYSLMTVAQSKETQEPYLVKSLSNESIKDIEVATAGGSISVTGGSASESKIEVYITSNNSKELSKEDVARRLEENYTLNISINNNKLTAIAKQKSNHMDWKKGLSISFKIYAPSNVNTDLATSGGSIRLKNITGNQDFSTSGGSLHVEGLIGNVKGRTSGGSIHLKESKGNLDLATSGGSIQADNSSGKINLNTSGGSIAIKGLNGDIKANTSGGSITGNNIAGELVAHTSGGGVTLSDMKCSLETSTSGGRMVVAVKEFGKYLKVENSGGNIELEMPANKGLDLDLSARVVNAGTIADFDGNIKVDEIKGKLKGGGIPVTVSAGSGKINLTLK